MEGGQGGEAATQGCVTRRVSLCVTRAHSCRTNSGSRCETQASEPPARGVRGATQLPNSRLFRGGGWLGTIPSPPLRGLLASSSKRKKHGCLHSTGGGGGEEGGGGGGWGGGAAPVTDSSSERACVGGHAHKHTHVHIISALNMCVYTHMCMYVFRHAPLEHWSTGSFQNPFVFLLF